MANKAFAAIGVSGGSSGFLDSIKTATISDQDIAFVIVNGTEEFYVYTFDSGNVAAESSPTIVYPDDAAGTEAWILCDMTVDELTVLGALSVTGAATLGSTLAVTGAVTCPSINVNSTVTVTGVLDEDNFASDSNVKLATQQSIKAYIATILGSLTPDIMAGFFLRPKFTWSDTDTITIGPARYHHTGTVEQLVKWDATLTFDFGSGGSNAGSSDLGVSEWHYLYIDDSAVVLAGTNVLTASEFINTTTAPTWSAAQGGWYSGNDRCIGAFYSNASSQLDEFFHSGGREIQWADVLNLGFSWTTSWKDCTMRLPSFATNVEALITVYTGPVAIYGWHYWRTNGQTGATGHICGYCYNSGSGDNFRYNSVGQWNVIADSSGVVEFKTSNIAAGTNSVIWQDGYVLPEGM